MSAGYEYSGFDSLRERLLRLTQNMRTRGNKQAVEAAGEEFATALRELVLREAHDTGATSRAIEVKVASYSSGTSVAIVGVNSEHIENEGGQRRRPSKYWSLINYGTAHTEPKRLLATAYELSKIPAQEALIRSLTETAGD